MSRAPAGASHRVRFLVLAVGMTAGALLQSLVIPALATFQEALDTTQADATWILAATLLASAIGTPIAGRLGDMLGRKQIFVAILSVTAVGCLLSAVATSLPLMLVGGQQPGHAGDGVSELALVPGDRVSTAVPYLRLGSAT